MADDNEFPSGTEPDYVSEKQRRYARFIELGGQETIYERLRAYRRSPALADMVTDQHRDLVMDLRAGGMRQEKIAFVMGISKERLQVLFPMELEAGVDVAEAAVSTSLQLSALAGDTQAALGFLKNHPEMRWGTKSEVTGKDGKDLIPENASQAEANQILLAGMLTALSTDKTKFKRPAKDKLRPVKVVESDKPKPVKAGTTRKKAKGD